MRSFSSLENFGCDSKYAGLGTEGKEADGEDEVLRGVGGHGGFRIKVRSKMSEVENPKEGTVSS